MLGISNALKAVFPWVQFEGGRSAEEIRKFWQSSEHPSINKQEWSTEEVERLKAIAAAHCHLEWHLVAEELGVRTRTCKPWKSGRTWTSGLGMELSLMLNSVVHTILGIDLFGKLCFKA